MDPALIDALKRAPDKKEKSIPVFIKVKERPDEEHIALLQGLGVRTGHIKGGIFTATLSAQDIEYLSGQPWVQYLRLSQKSRFLK